MVSIPLSERNRERTPEERAAFSEKLDYWRVHGVPGFKVDETEAFLSHADGKMYTSKEKYRADLKARGYEEKGDSRNAEQDNSLSDAERIADIKNAMGEL
jgi:hypothetical protein